jgi:DNA-binding PadR family transcriptional regulator
MPAPFLPELELYVMLAVARLEPEAYGAAVRKEIESRAARPVSIGALYSTLNRLQHKGLVSLREVEPTSGQRGRPRRYCSLTASGREALEHSVTMLGRMTEGLAYGSLSESRE